MFRNFFIHCNLVLKFAQKIGHSLNSYLLCFAVSELLVMGNALLKLKKAHFPLSGKGLTFYFPYSGL